MQRPTRVAIYARVSTTEQDPEAQLFALRTYAAQRGFEVYREYIDDVSGGKPRYGNDSLENGWYIRELAIRI
jgi:putative DNA-invertase from lambdoid prophage Rac